MFVVNLPSPARSPPPDKAGLSPRTSSGVAGFFLTVDNPVRPRLQSAPIALLNQCGRFTGQVVPTHHLALSLSGASSTNPKTSPVHQQRKHARATTHTTSAPRPRTRHKGRFAFTAHQAAQARYGSKAARNGLCAHHTSHPTGVRGHVYTNSTVRPKGACRNGQTLSTSTENSHSRYGMKSMSYNNFPIPSEHRIWPQHAKPSAPFPLPADGVQHSKGRQSVLVATGQRNTALGLELAVDGLWYGYSVESKMLITLDKI